MLHGAPQMYVHVCMMHTHMLSGGSGSRSIRARVGLYRRALYTKHNTRSHNQRSYGNTVDMWRQLY